MNESSVRTSEWMAVSVHVSERPMFAQFISYLIMLIDRTFDDVLMKVRSISRYAEWKPQVLMNWTLAAQFLKTHFYYRSAPGWKSEFFLP